ncbi:MAG: glycosylase [Acidobacteria bacterium]|nr:glycosylase [Acidobacteriota bacterium]
MIRYDSSSLPRVVLPLVLVVAATAGTGARSEPADRPGNRFPPELVDWVPYGEDPLFAGTGGDTWDREIRERGFVLREGDAWRLWYTGYNTERAKAMFLGYATSPDGLVWTRHPGNPVFDGTWTEDVHVLKHEGVYFMFAEGWHDVAHLLTSPDGLRWEEQGSLDIRTRSGEPLSPGPYGTPTVWLEDGTWNLFYERGDKGIWLATSTDRRVWTNVEDTPVIGLGPDAYDRHAVALNQVVRYQGRYYGVYHANADPEWKGPWTTCLAASDDLVHWEKYPGNPVIRGDASSGILVDDGKQLRLYTMHPAVRLWLPRGSSLAEDPGGAEERGHSAAPPGRR